MAYILNTKYIELESFIARLASPGWFEKNGTWLHNGRNKIKMFDANGIKVAVKQFGRLSLLNKIVYCTIRKSKARRAYEYAQRLGKLGINTPEEVAYIEIRKNGLLQQSYYVCLHTEYQSMLPLFYQRNLSPEEFNEITPLLDDLTQFLYKTHQAGVIHNDLNYTNILYKSPECGCTGYDFTLIDINRMEFYRSADNPQPLPFEKRLHNLRRLNVSVIAHLYIMQKYAQILGMRAQDLQLPVINMRYRFEYKRQRTQKIKNFIRGKKEE
ncbi:MAG: hypothetical protein IKD16_01180 [Bacteroidales bacterium]|nr:hypothetical protein [Bacteroidales bacterium]